MKDRKVLELILSLLIGFYGEDFIMDSFLNGNRYDYFNKQILINCLYSLLILNKKTTKTATKLFEEDKNMELSIKIIDFIIKILISCREK